LRTVPPCLPPASATCTGYTALHYTLLGFWVRRRYLPLRCIGCLCLLGHHACTHHHPDLGRLWAHTGPAVCLPLGTWVSHLPLHLPAAWDHFSACRVLKPACCLCLPLPAPLCLQAACLPCLTTSYSACTADACLLGLPAAACGAACAARRATCSAIPPACWDWVPATSASCLRHLLPPANTTA